VTTDVLSTKRGRIFAEDANESGRLRVFLREARDIPDLVSEVPVV